MKSVLELQKVLGLRLQVAGRGSIKYLAEVKDVRLCFGREQWLVVPVSGSGEAWIDAKEGC